VAIDGAQAYGQNDYKIELAQSAVERALLHAGDLS